MILHAESKIRAHAELRRIDVALASFLIERFQNAYELGRIKTSLQEPIRDQRREREVIRRIAAFECPNVSPVTRRRIFLRIMAVTRKLEDKMFSDSLHSFTRAQLLAKKRAARNEIDKLDSEIVRLLDRRSKIAKSSSGKPPSQRGLRYDKDYINSIRAIICELRANSDIKQGIWEIFCGLFEIDLSFVSAVHDPEC
jgi:chorismate mutase